MSEDKRMRGILGLANLGNTCYMNATIQALRHCPEWTLYCTQNRVQEHITDPKKSCSVMTLAYQDLLKSIWGGTGPGYVRPLDFYSKLSDSVRGTIYDDFMRRTPQDAHEFLVWLLDQMYMGTQKEVNIAVRNEASLAPMTLQAVKGWKAAFEKQYSPLTDLVFGMYRIQYECKGCAAVHTRWETFNTLKVSLAQKEDGSPMTLEEMIEHEFRDEEIEGYHCDACKEKPTAIRRVTIWRLPKILIVTLKRFTPMGTRDNRPLNYDGHALTLGSSFAPESHEQSKTHSYKLFSTVDHHGHHMGGHYPAQTYNPVWKVWHLYDDETAHSIEKPRFGPSTYIMMFR